MINRQLSLNDFYIPVLGTARYDSPLVHDTGLFVSEKDRIAYPLRVEDIEAWHARREPLPSFEPAGPRRKLFFEPAGLNCGIVTCGGLCPGINNVIRAIVYESYLRYGVKNVYGFRFGYQGLVKQHAVPPVRLDTDMVNDIHEKGGTMLGSSRGPQDTARMVDYLCELQISILFTIGGDGTLRGAAALIAEISRRSLPIAVIAVPKTIDNDISCVEKSFGFETAVQESMEVIQSAHIESKGAEYGIGLVKLMGRDSGFIAAQATLANTDVNFCLVPEVDFQLDSENGLLEMLKKRLIRRRHAVIVVAEGAGQSLCAQERRTDASGNILHEDIGVLLRDRISGYFRQEQMAVTIKYIDPSYIIRSKPANAGDSLFCLQLGQHAVHAGMAGRTSMLIGYWSQHYTHVPLHLAVAERKKLSPRSSLWQAVLAVTEQAGPHVSSC